MWRSTTAPTPTQPRPLSPSVNGSDNGKGEFTSDMKKNHPEWIIDLWHPFWNFEFKEVRDLKVNALR